MSRVFRQIVEFGTFSFDLSEHTLRNEGMLIDLPSRTASILQYLIENRDRVISKEELKNQIWPNLYIELNSIDQHICRIRDALGDSPRAPQFIKTKYKQGWQFVANTVERTVTSAMPSAEQACGVEPISTTSEAPANTVTFSKDHRPSMALALSVGLFLTVGMALVVWSLQNNNARILESVQLTNDGKLKNGPLLSDGRRLFFMETFEGGAHVVSIPLSGGRVTRWAVPLPHYEMRDISRDGSMLLLQSSGLDGAKVWTYSLASSSLRQIGSANTDAAWSSDGILAMSGPDATWIRVFGGDLRGQWKLFGTASDLAWAPDGRTLRFSLAEPRDKFTTEWQITARNPRPERLNLDSKGQTLIRSGTWSADGRYFFYEGGTNPHRDIWVMREKSKFSWTPRKPFRLTSGEPGSWRWPRPLSDGSTIVSINEAMRPELARFDLNTQSWKPEWDGVPAYELDYSRDAQWVTYVNLPDHTVWKARPDGSGGVRLTNPGLEAHQPHWSPDNTRIAFMGENAQGRWRIFQVTAKGGQPEELAPSDYDQGVPTWAPDGRFIIFGERLSAKPRNEMALHLLDLNTRKISNVEGSKGLWSPRWSPSGQYVSAVTSDFHGLRLARWPEMRWTELARMKIVDHTTWTANSEYIYFNGRDDSDHWWLCRIRIHGGHLERVIDLANFTWATEGWFGLSCEGAPLGLRGVTMQEIYALKCVLP